MPVAGADPVLTPLLLLEEEELEHTVLQVQVRRGLPGDGHKVCMENMT